MADCKFKDPSNKKLCKVTHGYCQFNENGYEDGHACPIKDAYKDYTPSSK